MTRQQSRTSNTGGWCNMAVRRHHVTDKALASALAELFAGWTVVGLGEGRGKYRQLILGTGKVQRYDAYDGAPNIREITTGQVIDPYYRHIFCFNTIGTQKLKTSSHAGTVVPSCFKDDNASQWKSGKFDTRSLRNP